MLRNLVLLATLLPATLVYAAEADIPENLQGRWVDQNESCEASTSAMVVSATTLVYADGTIDDVYFSPDENAIRIREEGVSYEYIEADDKLLFRPEGFGMGSVFPMQRCQDRTSVLERRCGWLANLTPGDWWLIDADRTWTLSEQGKYGETIAVMDMVPSFDTAEFVSTGTDYGYGCACMTVTTDSAQGRVLGIASSKRLPLTTCQVDTTLPALSDW